MDSILNKLPGLITGIDGKISNKRFITMLCSLLLAIGFIANVFLSKHIDDNVLNAVMFVIISGMGVTGVEKFAPKNSPSVPK